MTTDLPSDASSTTSSSTFTVRKGPALLEEPAPPPLPVVRPNLPAAPVPPDHAQIKPEPNPAHRP
ncbi:MAG: DNA polymerase III subunit gamma/tau, partial [bacterium]